MSVVYYYCNLLDFYESVFIEKSKVRQIKKSQNFITNNKFNFMKVRYGGKNIYRTRAIISHVLYIFYPIFQDHFFVFKEVFFRKFYSYVWLIFKSGL